MAFLLTVIELPRSEPSQRAAFHRFLRFGLLSPHISNEVGGKANAGRARPIAKAQALKKARLTSTCIGKFRAGAYGLDQQPFTSGLERLRVTQAVAGSSPVAHRGEMRIIFGFHPEHPLCEHRRGESVAKREKNRMPARRAGILF